MVGMHLAVADCKVCLTCLNVFDLFWHLFMERNVDIATDKGTVLMYSGCIVYAVLCLLPSNILLFMDTMRSKIMKMKIPIIMMMK